MTITYICPGLLKVAVNCNMNIGLTRASQRVNQWPTLTFKHNMVFYFATYWSFNLMYWVPKFIVQILSQACAYFVWLNIVLHNIDYMADFPVTLAKKKIILIERGRRGMWVPSDIWQSIIVHYPEINGWEDAQDKDETSSAMKTWLWLWSLPDFAFFRLHQGLLTYSVCYRLWRWKTRNVWKEYVQNYHQN